MKNIQEYICEATDMLNHELHINDWIGFKKGKLMIYGVIKEITKDDKPKYIVKSLGFWGDPSLKTEIKPEYKVNIDLKTLFQVTPSEEEYNALKEKNII